jgi:hypothetical protein
MGVWRTSLLNLLAAPSNLGLVLVCRTHRLGEVGLWQSGRPRNPERFTVQSSELRTEYPPSRDLELCGKLFKACVMP